MLQHPFSQELKSSHLLHLKLPPYAPRRSLLHLPFSFQRGAIYILGSDLLLFFSLIQESLKLWLPPWLRASSDNLRKTPCSSWAKFLFLAKFVFWACSWDLMCFSSSMLQKLSLFSYDACVLDVFVICWKKRCFLGGILLKDCFFPYGEFMIEKILFLHLQYDFDVTKNILKHKTLKSLFLEVQKVAPTSYPLKSFILFFLETRQCVKVYAFIKYVTF